MDDISWPAEVHDHGYGAGCESFENYARAVVAKGWKDKYIRGSHPIENVRMAYPSTERNSLLNSKGSRQLLKAFSLRSVTDDGEAGRIASQKWGGSPQCQITSFSGDQAPNEDQFKLGARLRTARPTATQRGTDAGLRDKKQFVAIFGKLRTHLGRSGYNRRRVAVGRPGKRQEPVRIPQARDPFPLVVELDETGRPGQAAIERPDHEWYRPLAQKESERARHTRRHRYEAQNDIELACKDAVPQLSPGLPFKGNRKGIAECGH